MGNFGSTILDAYFAGQQNKMRREQLAQQKAQQEAELKLRQEQVKNDQQQFDARLKQDREQFNALQTVREAGQTLKETVAKQKAEQDKNTFLLKGSTAGIFAAPPSAANNFTPQIADPTQIGTNRAAMVKPTIEANTAAKIEVGNNAAGNQMAINSVKIQEQGVVANELQDKRAKLALELEARRNASRMAVAQIRTSKEAKEAAQSGKVDGLLDLYETGDANFETMTLERQNPAQRQAIKAAADAKGITILTPRAVKDVQNFKTVNNLVSRIEKFNNKINEANGLQRIGASVPLIPTELKTEYKALLGEIGVIARSVGEDKGVISDRDITRFSELIPNPSLLAGYNHSIVMKSLTNAYKGLENKVLSPIANPLQRVKIKRRWDISDIGAEPKGYFKE